MSSSNPEIEFVEVEIDVAIDQDGDCCAAGPDDGQTAASFLAERGSEGRCVQSYTVKLRLPLPLVRELDMTATPIAPAPIEAELREGAPE